MADAGQSTSAEQAAMINRAVGAAIRKRRDELRLTQGELAMLVDISRASIANIERGEQTVSVPLLLRLAASLDCSPADLLEAPQMYVAFPENKRPLLELENLAGDDSAKLWVAGLIGSSFRPGG